MADKGPAKLALVVRAIPSGNQLAFLRRAVVIAGAATTLLGAAASPASAFLREGTGSDASGDSAGGANRDIVQAGFKYDSNGQITVRATMAAPIDPDNADAHISFRVATAGVDGSCSGANISLFGPFSGSEGYVTVTGVSRYGSATKVINGATISFTVSNSVIANRDYTCTAAVVTNHGNTQPEFRDEVVPNVFAAGFGPDRDGDGKTDNVDACPDQAGGEANGCPSPDRDRDGVPDRSDACPDRAGAGQPNGCPATTGGGGGGGTTQPPSGGDTTADETGPTIKLPSSNRSVVAASSGVLRFKIGPSVEDTTGVLLLKTAGKIRTKTGGKSKVIALGTKSFQALDGQTVGVKIKLSKTVLKYLRSKKRLRTQANITLRDDKGNATIEKYTFTIKAPKR